MKTSDWITNWSARKGPFKTECEYERARLLDDIRDPRRAQQQVLEDLVHISADSLHWKKEKFSGGPNPSMWFRRTLPIRRYDDFEPLLDAETHTKGGVLSCSPVIRWLKTSGTMGVSKKIPYTLHWLVQYRIPAMKAMWATYIDYHPALLSNPYAVLDTQTVRESSNDFVHGVPHQAISNRHPRVTGSDWNPPWYEAPWFGPSVPSGNEDRMYYRLRHLIGKDLRFISSINPSTLISLRDHLLMFAEALIKDVSDGTLKGVRIDDGNQFAARNLERVLQGPDVSLRDVWPTLELFSCWLSASAKLYSRNLSSIFPNVARIPFMSCGTEGVVTIPVDNDPDSQPLAVNQAYYEFVPASEDLDAALDAGKVLDTMLFDELKIGEDYHLVMSQGNGLYRLVTGDIFRVAGKVGDVPRLHFVRRAGVFHSFTGEKLTEAQVTEAITVALAQAGLGMGLYMCGPCWETVPFYIALAETQNGHGIEDQAFAHSVDETLQRINIEYASKRESKRLDGIRVITVPPNSISRYVDRKRANGNSTQFKYKPFHQDTKFVQEIINTLGN